MEHCSKDYLNLLWLLLLIVHCSFCFHIHFKLCRINRSGSLLQRRQKFPRMNQNPLWLLPNKTHVMGLWVKLNRFWFENPPLTKICRESLLPLLTLKTNLLRCQMKNPTRMQVRSDPSEFRTRRMTTRTSVRIANRTSFSGTRTRCLNTANEWSTTATSTPSASTTSSP